MNNEERSGGNGAAEQSPYQEQMMKISLPENGHNRDNSNSELVLYQDP